MSEREIGKIRKKILLLSTASFFGVMLLMGSCIYFFSWITIRNESHNILRYIAQNDGEMVYLDREVIQQEPLIAAPEEADDSKKEFRQMNDYGIEWNLDNIFGMGASFAEEEEMQYSIRYFAVLFDQNQKVGTVKVGHIASISEENAAEYAAMALDKGKEFGNFGRYFYHVANRQNGETIVIYLDRSTQIMQIRRILVAALCLLAIGTLLAFLLMRVFSKQFVRTEIENAEKQKQFITNASHELKTPLAVIRANTEMTEMMDGETEWTQSTLRQVDRMNGLIQNLVKIARTQEEDGTDIREIDISPAVKESAESFEPLASGDGKKLEMKIASPMIINADEGRIRQIVSLLTDNAVKYCDAGGTITVSLAKSGKGAILTVSNDYAEGKNVNYSRFFERFYRQDEARTIQGSGDADGKSGYGIGLSLTESLVRSMKGTIDVHWKNGVISFVCRFYN